MVSSRSVVWLGLTLSGCIQSGWSLLKSDSQDLSYNYPSNDGPAKLPSIDSPPLDGVVRSLLNGPYDAQSSEIDRRTTYPTRGNIRKSFSLLTTTSTTTPRIEPHFEALSNNRDETRTSRKKTLYINNEKIEVENSQELIDKFKTLKKNYGIRSTERPPYGGRTYEEALESSSLEPHLYSSSHRNDLQPLPIRHWSTESNVIRDDELRGSSYPYSFTTPSPSTRRPYNYRGSVRYNSPTTEKPITSTYSSGGYEPSRGGKYIPKQLFKVNDDLRNVYIVPTTYRPPFRGDSYSFSFRTQDHSRQESGDTRGNFRGSVKYMDTLGRDKQIDYEGNPQRGLVTSEIPFVSVAGRTGQRYLTPVTTPRAYTPNGLSYSYSYRTDDPISSSTVPYDNYAVYSSTVRPFRVYSTYPTISRPTPDGSYVFSYNAGDHERKEIRDPDGSVRGMYSYEGPDGERKLVEYRADAANGFVAQGSHIPVQQGRVLPGGDQYPGGRPLPGGAYYFAYNAGDHARQEVRDEAGNVHGSFSFVTADGDTRAVNYQAKPGDGFAVSGSHIPYTIGK